MRIFIIALLAGFSMLFCQDVKSQNTKTYDPAIQTIVDAVNGDTIWNDISDLVVLQRLSTNTSAIQSSDFLKNYFLALGFDTVFFQTYQSGYIPNVIAVKNGTTYPDSVILVGAHYDVYASNAPGADDNGSGTAAVMETGRVIMGHEYKRTIKLVCFSGEEQGLLGSDAYASVAASSGELIKAAITMDMIAYLKSGDPINSDVYFNTASTALKNNYASITGLYVLSFPVANATYPTNAGSDVEPFWNNGFNAIFPCEGQYNWLPQNDHCSPYMHTANDVLNTSANSQVQATKITQSVVATVVTLAELDQQTSSQSFYGKDLFDFSVSPNPASTAIDISFNIANNSEVRITLIDMRGKTLRTFYNATRLAGAYAEKYSVADVNPGIYLLQIISDDVSFTRKIIICN
jgi:aminopeptidase YwaD